MAHWIKSANEHAIRRLVKTSVKLVQFCTTKIKFLRLELGHSVIYSHEYKRPTKRNDYTIMYGSMEFGQVEYFLEVVCDKNIIVLALIYPFWTTEVIAMSSLTFEHLLEAKKLDEAKFIKVEDIQRKCIFLEIDVKSYMCSLCMIFA